jgi:hypothetical protein
MGIRRYVLWCMIGSMGDWFGCSFLSMPASSWMICIVCLLRISLVGIVWLGCSMGILLIPSRPLPSGSMPNL